jgi:hypothetical protein
VFGALSGGNQARVHGRRELRERLGKHYAMAAYGTLVAWAKAIGHTEAAKLLQQTLDEEKAADKKLSGLAEGGINQSAADVAHADDGQEPVGAAASSAPKSSAKAGRR